MNAMLSNVSVVRSNESTLMQASRQWASRPADQRYLSLTDMQAHFHARRAASISKVIPNRMLDIRPLDDGNPDRKALAVLTPAGETLNMTNWAFGQVCQRADAPAGFLRSLPADIVTDVLRYRLHHERDVEELGTLAYRNGGPAELCAVTGPNYGRIWNATVLDALVKHFGDGRTGDFRVPGEFGQQVEITKNNTTLYASDRDMFVFLADEDHRIDVPGRRDGRSGSLARGIFVWNSEVGSTTLGMAAFLFDYVCCNRIVWGAQDYQEIRIRHTAGAPSRWIEDAMPAIEAFKDQSTASIEQALKNAQLQRVKDADEFLTKARFSKSQVSAIKAAHLEDEQRPIETLWDAVTGITAYARGIQYQDKRVELERVAGKLLAA